MEFTVNGNQFYVSMSYHISQLVPRGIAVFLLKHFIFLENGKNCHSIVFTVLQIHIKTESLKADSHVSRNHLLLTTIFMTVFIRGAPVEDNNASECVRILATTYGCKILQLYEYNANV